MTMTITITKSYIHDHPILTGGIQELKTAAEIHAELIKNGVINPNTGQPYSVMTIKRLIQHSEKMSYREYMLKRANKNNPSL
jgi:hypothetical protein